MATASDTERNTRHERPSNAIRPKSEIRKSLQKNWQLYLLLVVPLVFFILFRYLPMYGIILSFRRYRPGAPFGVDWVGLRYFEHFLTDATFWNVFKNTFVLSGLALLIGFPIPIVFALLLNEVGKTAFKKIVQTVSYLPKFLSVVVVVLMINNLLSPSTGAVNGLLKYLGLEPIFFLNESRWFRAIYVASDIWQFMGYNAILYLAALPGIDEALYEAAALDGADRWQQTLNITIPGIMPTIIITFIIAVGNMLNYGFEKIYLLYNPNIYDVADVIQTFVFRIGLEGNNFSYATAVGLFQAVIGLALLWVTNSFARKYSETSFW